MSGIETYYSNCIFKYLSTYVLHMLGCIRLYNNPLTKSFTFIRYVHALQKKNDALASAQNFRGIVQRKIRPDMKLIPPNKSS